MGRGEQTGIHKRILVVDDDPASLALIGARLEASYSTSLTNNIPDALTIIVNGSPLYFVLTDLVMKPGEENGIDLIRKLRKENWPVPVIAMSGIATAATAALAVRDGAVDFLDKDELTCPPEGIEKIISRIEEGVSRFRGQYQELKELKFRAEFDVKTGLYNFATFELDIEREIARHNRSVHPRAACPSYNFSLLFIDFNNMKEANDQIGHLYVDENLLRNLGRAGQTLRQGIDRIYRYGGDEVIVLLPETNQAGARVASQRLIDNYDSGRRRFTYEDCLRETGGETLCSPGQFESLRDKYGTLSVGIVETPVQKIEKGDLIQRVESAMYRAKVLAKQSQLPQSTIVAYTEENGGN